MAKPGDGKKEKEKTIEVDLECVQKGMKSAKDLYNDYGTIVIRKHREIESKHISQLKMSGVKKIEVLSEEEASDNIKPVHIRDYPQHAAKFQNSTFMIVDDSRSVRMVMKSIIEEVGLKVVGAAGNVADAVERAGKLRPTHITMDISMPGGDGTEAIKPILGILPDTKIIMISTLGYQDRIVEALELGAVQFISKPFDRRKLQQILINTIVNQ